MKNTQTSHQAGFTLIELLVVIVIIGILAAIAIPAYRDYLVHARVTELINAGTNAKTSVVEYRLGKGTMPTSNEMAGVSDIATDMANSVTIGANGIITITGNQTNLGTEGPINILLTPTYSNGVINWTCTATGETQYAPSSCR